MFSQYKIGATTNTLAAGSTRSWLETRPGMLVPVPVCGNKTTESGEQCDDGNTVDGDGCSAACKLEGSPGGVLGFTAQRAAGVGAVLTWKTQALKNCKTFQLLRCVGASCTGAGTHKVLTSIGPVTCKYTKGGDTYQYLDTSAPALPQISYYLRQNGVNSAYTDHGPAIIPAVPPDLGPPDLSPPDPSVPDQTPPDMALPDQAMPDQAKPDQAMPDKAIPDMAPPDTAPPDSGSPDTAATDTTATDTAAPDSGALDTSADSNTPADTSQPAADLPVVTADGGAVKGDAGVSQGGCGGCGVSTPGGPGGLAWILLGFLAIFARRRR